MKLLYTPEGKSPQQFDFEPGNLLSTEAEAIECWCRDLGIIFGYGEKLASGNVRAMRALLWVMLRRSDPSLEFDAVVFRLDEFRVEDDDEPVGKDEADGSTTDSPSVQPV
jgi:hypothetical protein